MTRPHYWPGVVTFAAASRFLRVLRHQIKSATTVFLAEAFLSFKKSQSSHSTDAKIIFDQFWDIKIEQMVAGTEPILDLINGFPSVRVFCEQV